jgi:adenosine deaminase
MTWVLDKEKARREANLKRYELTEQGVNSESFYSFLQSIFKRLGFTLGFTSKQIKAQLFLLQEKVWRSGWS